MLGFDKSEQFANLLGCVQVPDAVIGEALDQEAEALDSLACSTHVDDCETVFEGLELESHEVACLMS